ncbi:hypothetical protein MAM1_0195d07751 [Mucor ambiguus]|uniref:Uncharacterized protein n=1 Tax=Mucor ambiguus TaxID=91626 RepID=A0A0C9ML57_9FUNG|nr:hypothetical protein MAM1_0195d07751 [Mucor ambiguus]
MPLNIATNISFRDEDEGDAVDSKADHNGGTDNAVEAKVIINAIPNKRLLLKMMLAYLQLKKCSKNWVHLRPHFSR